MYTDDVEYLALDHVLIRFSSFAFPGVSSLPPPLCLLLSPGLNNNPLLSTPSPTPPSFFVGLVSNVLNAGDIR